MSQPRDEWMKKPEHEREQHAIALVVDASSGEKGKFARWLAEHDRQIQAQALRDAADALGEYGNTMTAARGHLELIASRLEGS
jgi:hypothetical protein